MQLIPIQALWIPKVIPLKLLLDHSRLQTFQEGLQNIQNLFLNAKPQRPSNRECGIF